MNRKNKIKAIVALAVALAFVMPGAFANVDTIGVTSNSENTGDMENIVETSTNSDTSDDSYNTLTLPVHNLDTGLDYATIQEAIDATQTLDDHTIYVDNGIYYEYLIVDKSINLVGESKEGTIMDGRNTTDTAEKILYVSADNVNVDSFTIRNGKFGPYFYPSSYSSMTNCITNNIRFGIHLRGAKYNHISDCINHGNEYGIYVGGVGGSDDYNTVTNCTCYDNECGIKIKDTLYNTVTNCTFQNNSEYGVYILGMAKYNEIYHNNFVNNMIENALASGGGYYQIWDNGYPSGGNYWSDFDEPSEGAYDNNDDGIVDTPYQVPEESSPDYNDIDNYPLMNPWVPTVQPVMSILPATQTKNVGNVFTVDVYIDPEDYLISGANLDLLSFDPAVIQATDPVTFTSFFPQPKIQGFGTVDNVAGTITGIYELTTPLVGVGTEGTWLTIEFTAVGLGTSPITMDIVGLPDENGDKIKPITVINGEVIIEPPHYILDITIEPSAGGTVDAVPEPEPNGYAEGTSVELIPDAEDGYTFASWDGTDGHLVDVDNKIIMTKDMNVTATFTQLEYTLTTTMSGTGSGAINRDDPGPVYHYNDVVQLTAVSNAGSEFTKWTGAITGITNPDNVTITGNMNVDAEFTLEEYTLTIIIDPIGSGSVGVSPDGPYNYNDEVTLTPDAALGWSFAGWSGPDNSSVVDNKIIMTKDMEVTATFTKGWELPMNFTGDVLGVDTVVFGETADANNSIDPMDIVKPDAPPAPYIYAYLKTDLPTPYDILWEEYRFYDADNDLQIWDLFVETDTAGGPETGTVIIAWDNTILAGETQYEHIGLYDVLSGDLLEDMKTNDTFVFTADSGMANHFQIICSDNHAPVAVPDSYETMEAHELNVIAPGVLANDYDEDGDPLLLTAIKVTDPTNGTLTFNADGSFDYMPDLGFFGTDSFTYKAYDGALESNIATVYIEVLELNHIEVQDGWNLISMPVGENIDKTTIIVRFDGSDYTWTDAVAEDIIADPTFGWNSGMYADETTLIPGEGYWMWSYEDCKLLIPSNAEADNHITNLAVAWNLVGIPYDTSLEKTGINVYYNGDLYPWEEAVNEGIILDPLYDWDRTSQNYALTDTFAPGYGYWMYAYHGCALKKA